MERKIHQFFLHTNRMFFLFCWTNSNFWRYNLFVFRNLVLICIHLFLFSALEESDVFGNLENFSLPNFRSPKIKRKKTNYKYKKTLKKSNEKMIMTKEFFSILPFLSWLCICLKSWLIGCHV